MRAFQPPVDHLSCEAQLSGKFRQVVPCVEVSGTQFFLLQLDFPSGIICNETNIEIANWGRVIHQECLLYMDMHHINRLYLPAKERYEQLLREQPDVIHRAQLGYIASFLGMTPQHLSRLRSES